MACAVASARAAPRARDDALSFVLSFEPVRDFATLRSFAACAILCAFGCGASPRVLQQSSVYYERCRSAELNPDRTVDERRECWVAWLKYYANDQPIERKAYAQERRIALAHGETVTPLPDSEQDPAYELRSTFADPEDEEPETLPSETRETADSSDASETEDSQDEIASAPPFRQDQGAPPGRHFPVRALPPAPDAPPPPPPDHGANVACKAVCDPNWNECVARCERYGSSCFELCETRHLRCVAACH